MTLPLHTIDEAAKIVTDWTATVPGFRYTSHATVARHLMKEWEEWKNEPLDPYEAADMFILLCDYSGKIKVPASTMLGLGYSHFEPDMPFIHLVECIPTGPTMADADAIINVALRTMEDRHSPYFAGSAMYYVIAMSKALGIDLPAAFYRKMDINKARSYTIVHADGTVTHS